MITTNTPLPFDPAFIRILLCIHPALIRVRRLFEGGVLIEEIRHVYASTVLSWEGCRLSCDILSYVTGSKKTDHLLLFHIPRY